MRKILLILLSILFNIQVIHSQNAPITTCGSAAAGAPGNIAIPVTVTGFNNIGAISLTLEYDYSVVQYVSHASHPQLNFAVGDADLGNGFHRISMGWFGSGKTLPDGTVIITITFNYTAGNTALAWFDDGPSCEYADGSYNVLNDIPTSTYYINGSVCALVGAPGTISGDDSVCPGESGLIYSISQVPNATGYTWSVPAGAILVSGQGTNSITVDYPSGATSGSVSVFAFNACGTGPATELPVTVNALPLADAGDDLTINYGTSTQLQAAPGGSGTYSYHWSPEDLLIDPNVQNPQTIIMTSTTLFTLVVTDLASLCQSTDQVVVTVTGGPLSVNPVASPGDICTGGSAQLFANAGGGSGNYTYQWTCVPPGSPAWSSNLPDPIVNPETSTHYILVVNDGFTNTNGSTDVDVNQLPTATISGGDTLCGSGLTTVLTIDLTGVAPWNFTYTFGNTTIFIYNQASTPYTLITGDPGTYTVTYVEDAHCTGYTSGSATVAVFPVPAQPEITVEGTLLTSSACCGNQWYFEGAPVPGATDQTYTATQSGEYFVVVTLNSCSSEPSETVDVLVGIGENEAGGFSIYPNPAKDFLVCEFSTPIKKPTTIHLNDLAGKQIRQFALNPGSTGCKLSLDGQEKGIYLMVLEIEGQRYIRKLVIL
jgi:hypothetical protein